MQALDFNYIVVPLSILVIVLVSTILLMESRRELLQDKKIKRAIEKIKKEKAEKQLAFRNEQQELDRLHETKAIDNDTYNRLSALIRMNEQKLEETMDTLLTAKDIAKKPKVKPTKAIPEIKF